MQSGSRGSWLEEPRGARRGRQGAYAYQTRGKGRAPRGMWLQGDSSQQHPAQQSRPAEPPRFLSHSIRTENELFFGSLSLGVFVTRRLMTNTDLCPTSKQKRVVWAVGCMSLRFRGEIPSGNIDLGILDAGDINPETG